MASKIILIDNISDLNTMSEELSKTKDIKIFSFNLEVHNDLESKKIEHEIADDLLNQEQRFKIFDKMTEFQSWYSKIHSADYEFEGVNLLKMFDSHEFSSYLMSNLINLVIIKKIIDKEKPIKIIASTLFSNIIQSIIKQSHVETEFFKNKINKKSLWDKITFKYNVGRIPFSFSLSRKKYLQIKNFIETVTGFFYGFWFNLDSTKKKSIIFLEFNPQSFSKLFQALSNYDGNVILINQRRSVVWGKNSLSIIKKSKCKVLKINSILTKEEKTNLSPLINEYSKKINALWENSKFFDQIFKIEDCSFWRVIKEVIVKIYHERLPSHILLIHNIKKIFENIDVKCIVSLNETGETEKAVLEFNNNKNPSILLEHGFIERIPKTKRFDVLADYFSFKDKIAVWGETKKEWLVNEYGIDPKRIIVTGSPRHDDYFQSRLDRNNRKEKILLLAPNPINDINGLSSTNFKLRLNNTIKNIFSIVNKFENVKIIVKLHPIQLKHNEEIKSLIQKLDNTIPIYLWTSIIDTINNADAVIVLSPEVNATPTITLESMILGKPTMNIYFDDKIPEYDHIKNGAILTILDNDNIENELKKILFDEQFQKQLRENADNFVIKFMKNRGTASEKFASILQLY